MKRVIFMFSLALLIGFTACDGNQPVPVTNDDKDANTGTVKPASQQAGGGYGSQPSAPASGGGAPAAEMPAGAGVDKPEDLVKLEKAFEKNPNDADAKKKLAQATYEFGRKINYNDALPPRVKYPQALKLFRRTLELEPEHQQAAAEKDQIERIYVSMGRPIPQ